MGYGACLDLVITNKPHRFQKLHSLDSLGDSDHVIISWELICLQPLKPSQRYTDSHCVPDSHIRTMIPGKYSTRAVSIAPWADINSILSSINWVPMPANTIVHAATTTVLMLKKRKSCLLLSRSFWMLLKISLLLSQTAVAPLILLVTTNILVWWLTAGLDGITALTISADVQVQIWASLDRIAHTYLFNVVVYSIQPIHANSPLFLYCLD